MINLIITKLNQDNNKYNLINNFKMHSMGGHPGGNIPH